MSNDKMREEFEAAWAEVMRGDDPAPGRKPLRSPIEPYPYRGDAAEFAWKWWQRSRESLEIELPSEAQGWSPNECSEADGFNDCLDRCISAIESAGLRVIQ